MEEYAKYDSQSGVGNFCQIKPGKDRYVRLTLFQVDADGEGSIIGQVKDENGTWHNLIPIYIPTGGGAQTISLAAVMGSDDRGLLLKDLYDGLTLYRAARNDIMFRIRIASGTDNYAACIVWKEVTEEELKK
ncbi:MAG: hypothetical protein ACE5IF_01965 [Candidatus Bathyarchaeia archaeon]